MNEGRAFSFRQAQALAKAFNKAGVAYLFIGKSGAIMYGYPSTTQDVDIYPRKDPQNGRRIVKTLTELGFKISKKLKEEIVKGKDFVQIKSGPFDIDLVFAPDGFESYDIVKARSVKIGQLPVASLEDIIKSKEAANRDRDRMELPYLRDFMKLVKSKKHGR